MTTEQQPTPDLVREDFLTAYVEKWNVTREYAEGLLEHVETGAQEDALADFYQHLCHLHTNMLLVHGQHVAQGLAVAIGEAVKLIPEDKKRAAEERWAASAIPATAEDTNP